MHNLFSPPPVARRRWLEAGLVAAFWLLILMLTVGRRTIDPRGPSIATPQLWLLREALEFLLWGLLTPGIFWLTRRYGFERTEWLRPVLLHVSIAVAVALVIDTFGLLTFNWLLAEDGNVMPYDPLSRLVTLGFLDELIIYLVVLAAGFARDYFLRYRERLEQTALLEADKARLQAQLTEAQLQTLRMQLNPHFLFNTLHAVSSLVERDPSGVRRMIARLSELLRYTLEYSSAQEIPLHQELDLMNRYLEIQQIRFQDRLDLIEEIAPDTTDALVPNLILQPLVENAIKHGISHLEGEGRIKVRAWRDGDGLCLRVEDNGAGIAGDGAPDLRQGVGLRNTRARLEGLYGDAHRLRFESAAPHGLAVEITVPFHTGADLLTHAVTAGEA